MLKPIEFEECNTPEKFEKLKAFALTFDPPHYLQDNGNRIVIAKRDELWIGYAEIDLKPIVISAWSKERCKPSDIWAAMSAFVGWAKLQYGSGYTTVPFDTKTFPEKVMNQLGFFRTKLELYKTTK